MPLSIPVVDLFRSLPQLYNIALLRALPTIDERASYDLQQCIEGNPHCRGLDGEHRGW